MLFKKWLILCLFCCSFISAAVPQIDKYLLKRSITSIAVSGNHILSSEEIFNKAEIESKVGHRIDAQLLKNDIKKIFSLGIFNKVGYSYEPYSTGVKLIFVVEETSIVNKIKFKNNRSFQVDTLSNIMQQKENEIIDYNLLENDIAAINDYYYQHGYTLSSIYEAKLEAENTLVVRFNEPEVGKIIITGNVYTKKELLLREFSLQNGDIYNAKTMKEDRKRLFKLGYFSMVSLPIVVPSKEEGRVDIKVRVKEKKKNTLNFGGGIASDEQFGFVKLNFINILNTGEQISLRLQTGQQRSYDRTSYKLRYFNPWFFDKRYSLGYSKYLIVGYESVRNATDITDEVLSIARDGFSIDLGWQLPFGKRYKLITEYKEEQVKESAVYPRISYVKRSLAGTYTYSGLEYSQRNIVNAGESFILRYEKGGSIGLWEGLELDLASVSFSKYDMAYNHFTSLTERSVIGARIRSGVFVSAREENILEGEEYSVGGGGTVRGYSDLHPIGTGPKMLVINLEYRYLIQDWLQGILFYDWGNAYSDVNIDPREFRSGAGFGARITTPIGPIRMDIGKGAGDWMFHFGLGQAF